MKIFLEDEEHKASDLLEPLKQLKKYSDNILYDISANIVVVRYFSVQPKEFTNFVNEMLNLHFETKTLKVFGVSRKNLTKYLKTIKHKNNFFDYYIVEDYLDSAIILRFYKNSTLEAQNQLIKHLTKDLNNFYYADRDITLSNAVFEILSLQKLKISIAESFTSGLVATTLVSENSGASSVFEEGYVVYSDEVKHKNLNVDNEILKTHTAVSAETAFEMATGLLDLTKSDIVIATTGYANHTDKELSGLFFTAIGDSQSVNVYKHKYVGSRKDTIKYGVNVALFETIKKLKQNSLKNIDFVV